jgi:lipopolysaccharide export LptBFGC system permease protein LptF
VVLDDRGERPGAMFADWELIGATYRVVIGERSLKEGNVDSEEQCKALCSSDPLCTGATYNSAKAYCWTRSGKGDIAIGLDTDNALISEIAQNVNNIKQLNDRLTELNQKIEKTLGEIVPEQHQQVDEKNAKQSQLQTVYKQLLEDRKNIDEMLKEYRMLDQQYDDNSIYTQQTNSAYILWFVFAILIVFFTLKLQFFPNLKTNVFRFIFWFCITVLFAIVTTHINNSPGFFLWGLIIVVVAFIHMKILPSP